MAGSLDSLETGNPLRSAVDTATTATTHQQLYAELSGEMHASLANDLVYLDRDFSQWYLTRFSWKALSEAMQNSPSAIEGNALASLSPRYSLTGNPADRLWANFGYSYQRTDGDSNAARSTLKGPDVAIGYDHIAPSGWLFGTAFRYADMNMDVDSRRSEADIDSYTLALHGGFQTVFGPGIARLLAGGVYAHHNIDGQRDVRFTAVNTERLHADYNADSYQLFLQGAYAIPVGMVWIEPFVDLAWMSMHTGLFTEKGGTAALRADSNTHNNLSQLIGLRIAVPATNRLRLEAQAGWRHTYGKLNPTHTYNFVAGGDKFGIRGGKMNRDEAVFDLRASYRVRDNLRVGLEANAALGGRGSAVRGGAFIALEW